MLNFAHPGEVDGAGANSQASVRASGLHMAAATNRSMNIAIALIALLFFFPLMILVGVAIWCQDRGPVFFAHRRIGRDGRKFPLACPRGVIRFQC